MMKSMKTSVEMWTPIPLTGLGETEQVTYLKRVNW